MDAEKLTDREYAFIGRVMFPIAVQDKEVLLKLVEHYRREVQKLEEEIQQLRMDAVVHR